MCACKCVCEYKHVHKCVNVSVSERVCAHSFIQYVCIRETEALFFVQHFLRLISVSVHVLETFPLDFPLMDYLSLAVSLW